MRKLTDAGIAGGVRRRKGAMMGQVFHWANLALDFLLELCALAALGYWGVWAGGGPVAEVALGLGAPLFAAVLWGLFAAPLCPCRSWGWG